MILCNHRQVCAELDKVKKKGKSNLCMTLELFPKPPELLALNSQVRKV